MICIKNEKHYRNKFKRIAFRDQILMHLIKSHPSLFPTNYSVRLGNESHYGCRPFLLWKYQEWESDFPVGEGEADIGIISSILLHSCNNRPPWTGQDWVSRMTQKAFRITPGPWGPPWPVIFLHTLSRSKQLSWGNTVRIQTHTQRLWTRPVCFIK